jgi:hypothetical protein
VATEKDFRVKSSLIAPTSLQVGSATITSDGSAVVLPANSVISDGAGGTVSLGSVDLTGYATESYVDTAVANVSVDLTGYATETYVNNTVANYLTISSFNTQISSYALTTDVNNALALKANTSSLAAVATSGNYNDLSNTPTIPSLTGYATESWVTSQGYITSETDNQTLSFANNQITISNGNTIDVSSLYQDLTGYATQNALGVRNLIINGDMRIAQRGTSSIYRYANGYYTADRWKMSVDNNWYSEFNIDVVTDVPDGQGFANALKYSIGYNGGNNGGANLKIQQRIEGQNIQHLKKGTSNAESLTLSFWVKSNKTGTYIAELYDVNNTRSISKSYTINAADTWEKKTITYAGDTTGTFGNDNNASLDVNLFLIAASAYTSGTLQTSWGTVTNANRAVGQVNFLDNNSNYYIVTGVQLEVGDTATPFEHRPYDMELARCQRYYETNDTGQNSIWSGYCTNGNTYYLGIPFKVTKRATPSCTFTSGGVSAFPTSGGINNVNTFGMIQYRTANGTSTQGYFQSAIKADAEL